MPLFTAKTNRKNFYFSDNSLAPQLTRLRTLPRQRQISGKIFLASILFTVLPTLAVFVVLFLASNDQNMYTIQSTMIQSVVVIKDVEL